MFEFLEQSEIDILPSMSKKHNAIIEIIHDSRKCGDYLGKILGKIIADYCVGELYILSKADPDDVILDIFDYIDNITYPPQWNETIYFFNNTSEIYEMSKFEISFISNLSVEFCSKCSEPFVFTYKTLSLNEIEIVILKFRDT